MTTQLYQDWIQQWDSELQKRNRKILLLQDNFSGHIVPPNLQNIWVENFEPNLTAHVQPNDQGIIRCFKAHYRARFIQQAVDHYDEGITPAEIYDINQLQAMRIADAAWCDVDTTTIRNCWKKAEILPSTTNSALSQPSVPISSLLHIPSTQMDPVSHAEMQVNTTLDDLVATGVLQTNNRMDIEDLLNPAGECHMMTETSDKEIYQAVIDSVAAWENAERNSGDDVDEDIPTKPRPTRRDVLKAISMIGRYIDDINNPIACKVEALLVTFNKQLRHEETKNMKETFLTEYFQRL